MRASAPDGAAALDALCRAYWYPLYAFARRSGCSPEAAQDATQEFFARLAVKNFLGAADPARGKFRSFLLGVMKHVLADARDRDAAQKRGGGAETFSLDSLEAEDRYRFEPLDEASPDVVFERRWAEAVLERALARLRDECDAEGRAGRFEELKGYLLPAGGAPSIAETAAKLGIAEGAVKAAVHRLRERFRRVFHEEVALTVEGDEEIAEEIRHLASVMSA